MSRSGSMLGLSGLQGYPDMLGVSADLERAFAKGEDSLDLTLEIFGTVYVPFADLTTLKADAVYGDAVYISVSFGPGQYVLFATGLRAHWNGSLWVAGGKPTTLINPTIPLPPPPTAANTKPEIVSWLQLAGVSLSTTVLMNLDVSELLDLVQAIIDGP